MERGGSNSVKVKKKPRYIYIVSRSIEIRGPSHKSRLIYTYIYIFPASMFYWAMDHVCATRHDAKSD